MPNEVNVEKSRDILQALREDSRRKATHRILRKLFPIVVAIGFLNFLLFVAGAFYFGGDAVNGKAEGERYYLWGYHSGTKGYLEVSHAVFDYSRWHAYSVMITWPLVIFASYVSKQLERRAAN
jgi:hypothetical protein